MKGTENGKVVYWSRVIETVNGETHTGIYTDPGQPRRSPMEFATAAVTVVLDHRQLDQSFGRGLRLGHRPCRAKPPWLR